MSDTTKQNWKTLSDPFNVKLNDALQQQHQAAQFVALVGHHLVSQKADDSNTNMEFLSNKNLLLGNALSNGMRIALDISNLKLSIRDKNDEVKSVIDLDGKTKDFVFNELKNELTELGVSTIKFKNKLHYEIPSHPIDSGSIFSIKDQQTFEEITRQRHNANIVLSELAMEYEQAEAVRIWPHHFDTGTFIPVSKNHKGKLSQSIGLGWAMPDSMVSEPYYYLSFWSETVLKGIEKIDSLKIGNWLMPNWNGAILKHSEILKNHDGDEQFEMVKSFFNSGISILKDQLKSV